MKPLFHGNYHLQVPSHRPFFSPDYLSVTILSVYVLLERRVTGFLALLRCLFALRALLPRLLVQQRLSQPHLRCRTRNGYPRLPRLAALRACLLPD